MRVKRFVDSFNWALEGIVHTLKTQRNMKIHFVVAFLVLILSLFMDITRLELIALFLSITLVIAMEMVNTSVEVIVDMIRDHYTYRARIAKNIAAGAVFMAAFNALIVGYLIFFDELQELSLTLIHDIRREPFHLTFINLGLLFIIVILIKTWIERGTPLEGGMPSGHSAIAFSLATIITIITGNVLITTLVLVLALMVVQSRLETGSHSMLEVIIGALIGILLTLVIFQLL